MIYVLRDQNGIMKAKLTPTLSSKVMKHGKGEFKSVKYEHNEKVVAVTVFEFKEDFVLTHREEIQMYFWKGDRLIPEDK